MIVDNGAQVTLQIAGVFDGMAGTQGPYVSFVPNRSGARPAQAVAGILAGVPVHLSPAKDAEGPFWTARFEVIA